MAYVIKKASSNRIPNGQWLKQIQVVVFLPPEAQRLVVLGGGQLSDVIKDAGGRPYLNCLDVWGCFTFSHSVLRSGQEEWGKTEEMDASHACPFEKSLQPLSL